MDTKAEKTKVFNYIVKVFYFVSCAILLSLSCAYISALCKKKDMTKNAVLKSAHILIFSNIKLSNLLSIIDSLSVLKRASGRAACTIIFILCLCADNFGTCAFAAMPILPPTTKCKDFIRISLYENKLYFIIFKVTNFRIFKI